MSKREKKDLVPVLRFPEFRDAGEWDEKTLRNVCEITNGKSNAQDHIEGGAYPLFDRSEVVKRSDEFLFDCEAVILPGEGMRFVPKYYVGKFDLHQRAYALKGFSCKGKFVYYSMAARSGLLARKAVQSTVLSLRLPILQNFPIQIPSEPEEQQKVADCLTSVDELITAQTQKLDALKAHKKGLMQQLFPAEGETLPRLRFPEFRDKGEWEEKSIGEFGEVVTGSTPSTARPEFYGGGIPFVSPADISDLRFVDETKTTLTALGFDETRPVKANSVLFVCIGSTIGKVAQNTRDCATNQQINSVILNDEHSSGFLYYALSLSAERIANLAGKQAVPIINKTLFSSVSVPVPKLREQVRIADCLASIDELITAQAKKVDALKAHKKGLMQQLFPVMDEVQG